MTESQATDLRTLILAVRDARGLTLPEKAVLYAIVARVDWKTGRGCTASIGSLAADSAMKPRACRLAVRALERRGVVKTDVGGGHKTNSLHIIVKRLLALSDPGTTCRGTPAPDAGGGGTTCRGPRHQMPGRPAPHAANPSPTSEPSNQAHEPKKKAARPPSPPVDPLADLPASLRTPEFIAAWQEFEGHRSEKRKPLTPRARKLIWAKIDQYGPAAGVWAINNSIASGWTGVFPEKFADSQDGQHSRASHDDLLAMPEYYPTLAEIEAIDAEIAKQDANAVATPAAPSPAPTPAPTTNRDPRLSPRVAAYGFTRDQLYQVIDAYPKTRQGSPGAAEMAVAVALAGKTQGGKTPEEAIRFLRDRVTAFAASPAGNKGQYTPLLKNWMEERGYDAEPASWMDEAPAEAGAASGPMMGAWGGDDE